MIIRKTAFFKDTTHTDAMGQPCAAITRIVALAVVTNPYAGKQAEDLSTLFDMGGALAADLIAEAVAMLPNAAVSYGKAAIVGVNGDMEHGGAMIHPKLGKPMRAALGGGASVIPSNVKVAALGSTIDVPLGHKDNAWSFDHFDTITVGLADAPRPNEIVLCMALSDGARPHPRVGSGPVVT